MSGFSTHQVGALWTKHADALDALPFVKHCFTSRHGGVSKGHTASLNLSFSREEKEIVFENYRILSEAEGFTLQNFVLTDQVHESGIWKVEQSDAGKGVTRPSDIHNIDALMTNVAQIPLAVFVADCGSILLADPVHRAVAAVHSGWRGTCARIAAKTLGAMKEAYGTEPSEVIAAIGPCIGPCCYEVGGEVKEAFLAQGFSPALFAPSGDAFLLDLWQANHDVLTTAGVLPRHISVAEICTKCHSDDYFSHRATNGKRGNLAAIIEIGG